MSGKYQAYPVYKDSGVEWLGPIPANWQVKRVKHLTQLNPSKSEVRSRSEDEHVSFIPMEAIGEQGELDASRSRPLGEVLSGYTYVADGDVMLAKITPCFENGKAAVATGLQQGIGFATTEVIPVRPNDPEDAKFFYYLLTSMPFKAVAEGSMYGAGGQKRVADSFVAEYHLAAPPSLERTQIAAFLDHETARIDRLIEKQQRLIELLKEKRQSVISHAVTKGLDPNVPMKDSGVEWLGQVPEHWDVCQFKFVTTLMQTGPFGSQLHAEDYVEDGIPLINPAHMKGGRLVPEAKASVDVETQERLSRHKLLKNDIILARRGELGRCAVVTGENEGWLCGTGSLKVSLSSRMVAEYCYQLISSDGVRTELALESKGSTMDNLNTELLGNVRIPLPTVVEQQQILSHICLVEAKFNALFSRAISQIRLLQERRTALISAAITGKIDVRNWQPNTNTQAAEPDLPMAAEQAGRYHV